MRALQRLVGVVGLLAAVLVGCSSPVVTASVADAEAISATATHTAASTLTVAATTRPTFDGKLALFGSLHNHSALSDDTTASERPQLAPLTGWEYARTHGLDFLAMTDHHKAVDATTNPLRLSAAEYTTQLFDAARTYDQQHLGAFVAIPGIEWGNTATGNHVNVFGAPTLPPDTILGSQYNALFTWAAANAECIQLNHPYSWAGESNRDLSVGNFGEALYADTGAYVQGLGPAARTMSIISSVAGGHISGPLNHNEDKTHRDVSAKGFAEYLRYLNMGFHLSPAANQDTHWRNWGTVTAARTGVWADTCEYRPLMDAIRANRVFATEDDELAVALQVRFGATTSWMGQTVALGSQEGDVTLVVFVTQGTGSDGDPTDEGPYTVRIWSDPDGIGGQEAAAGASTSVASGVAADIPFNAVAGEYVFLEVVEQNGKDNPVGDGEDNRVNATTAPGQDGLRDDLRDAAWTTPVWFTAGAAVVGDTFVWSVNSNKYHDPDCWAVKQIGSANRREGPAPAGKTKHACHP
jgi:hypothetical protein